MLFAATGNSSGLVTTGLGSGAGFIAIGGATGPGGEFRGGSTSGDGLTCTVTSGVQFRANMTGNITGNLSGSVGSVATGGITAGSFGAGAIDAAAVAADAGTEIGTAVWASATRTLTAAALDSVVIETGVNARQALAGILSVTAGVLSEPAPRRLKSRLVVCRSSTESRPPSIRSAIAAVVANFPA